MSDSGNGLTFKGQRAGSSGNGLTFSGNSGSSSASNGLTFGGSAPPTGGGAMDALLRSNPNPTAGNPSNAGSSGGGILGFLGRAGSGALNAIKGAPAGIFQLGKDVGTAAARGTENIANDVAYGATLGHLGGYNQAHLGGSQETPNYSHPGSALGSLIDTNPGALGRAFNEYPALNAARAGMAQTGNEIAHPTQFGKDFVANPTGTVLNTLANLALVAGPTAGLLKAPAAFEAGANGAEAAAEGGRLAQAAAAAEKAGHVAGKVAASPLLPFTKGLGVAGDVLGQTGAGAALADAAGRGADWLKNTDTMQKIAARQAVDPIAVQHLLIDKGEMAKEIARGHDVASQITPDPTEQAASVMLAHKVFGGVDENGQPAAAKIAAALSHPGASAVFDKLWNGQGEGLDPQFRPSADAARLALHAELGDLPGDQLSRLHAASEAIRAEAGDRQARELSGYGRVNGALSPDQTVPEPMQGKIAEMTSKEAGLKDRTAATADTLRATAARLADNAQRVEPIPLENGGIPTLLDRNEAAYRANQAAENAGTRAETATNAAENKAVKPTYLNLNPVDNPRNTIDMLRQARANLDMGNPPSNPLERALARQDAVEGKATAANEKVGAAGEKVIDTYTTRGHTAGTTEGIRTGKAQFADRLANIAERRASAAADRYDVAVKSATESAQAAPAQYRPALEHTADFLGGLRDEAKAAGAAGDGASADQLSSLAKDLEPLTKIGRFQGNVEQPVHTPAPSSGDINRATQDRSPMGANNNAATLRIPGSAKERTSNNAAYTLDAQRDVKIARVATQARNEFTKSVDSKLSASPTDVLGADHGLKGPSLSTAMDKAGYVAWDPASGVTDKVAPTRVTDNTHFLPKAIYNEVKRYSDGFPEVGKVGKSLDFVTRWAYKNPLQLSPSYLLKRVVGNAAVMATNGMSIPDLVKSGVEAVKLIRSGDAPASLDGSLIADPNSGAGRITRAIQTPAATIDRMSRVMMYLDQTGKGADPVEALRMSNKALGSFNSLGPYERDIVRRVFPVYPWMKQVATVAGRLSAEDPAAVVYALHMGEAASKLKWKNPSSLAEQFDPLTLFGIQPGDLVNPVLRGLFGASTGFNLASLKDVTRPPNESQHGPITNPGELAYFLGAQSPIGKLYEQSPLSGVNQAHGRFNTGEARLFHGKTVPAFVPPSSTPAGVFGPYWRQYLGNPREPAVNPAGQIAHQKNVTRAKKTGETYLKQVARLRAAGQNP